MDNETYMGNSVEIEVMEYQSQYTTRKPHPYSLSFPTKTEYGIGFFFNPLKVPGVLPTASKLLTKRNLVLTQT